MPIAAGPDLAAFLSMTRSTRSFLHVVRRLSRHIVDLARFGRATHLVNGVALIARLAKSAQDLGVTMATKVTVSDLNKEGDRITGVTIKTANGTATITARKGVVLACGGFPNDIARRKALFPRTPTGREHLALPDFLFGRRHHAGRTGRRPVGHGSGVACGMGAGIAAAARRWQQRPFPPYHRPRQTGHHRRAEHGQALLQ
jgi:succinate dehydrogenase/fumarate reductase flavoprotein subunit